MLDVELVQAPGALFMDANDRLHAGGFERFDPRTTDTFIGIGHRDDGSPHARLDHRVCAAGVAVGVGAGLEIDVKSAASGALAGLGEGLLFGVRLAGGSVVTLARELAFAHPATGRNLTLVQPKANTGTKRA